MITTINTTTATVARGHVNRAAVSISVDGT